MELSSCFADQFVTPVHAPPRGPGSGQVEKRLEESAEHSPAAINEGDGNQCTDERVRVCQESGPDHRKQPIADERGSENAQAKPKQVPTLTEELQTTSDRLSDASLKAQELRTSIAEFKAGTASALVSPITDRTTRIDSELAVIQSNIQDYRAEIEARQEAIAQLRKKLMFWIDLLSVIVSLALVWGGFGQFVLVYLAWKYLKTGMLPYQVPPAQQPPAEVTT